MLDPGKKDVNSKAYQRSTADPSGLSFPQKAGDEREEDNAREDEVDNENEIPCIPVFKERRKNHRAIRSEQIQQNVTNQNKKTDLIKTPEVIAPRYFGEDPTEEQRIKGNQEERMSKVSMIFKIKVTVEKAKNEIGVRKKSRNQTGDRAPIPNFFIINRFGNHRTCKRMSNTVHELMLTHKSLRRQIGNALRMG